VAVEVVLWIAADIFWAINVFVAMGFMSVGSRVVCFPLKATTAPVPPHHEITPSLEGENDTEVTESCLLWLEETIAPKVSANCADQKEAVSQVSTKQIATQCLSDIKKHSFFSNLSNTHVIAW